MNAPEDQNGLREALARYLHDEVNGVGGWPSLTDKARDNWRFSADRLIAGPLASLIAGRDEKCERLWGLWMAARDRASAAEAERDADRSRIVAAVGRSNDWREAARAAEDRAETIQATLNAEMEIQAEVRASLRAAEAEITRLKEGMEALGAALKPFAAGADIADADAEASFYREGQFPDDQEIDPILPSGETPVLATLGDFRAARNALATLSPKEQP